MGQIKVEKNAGGIQGLCVIEPTVHGDARGYFMETYNQKDMEEAGLTMQFVQDNQSSSTKGVLRGLHFQKEFPQGKLVRVVKGSVFDVAVDLRSDSETYGKWFGVELTEENKKQFYIPIKAAFHTRTVPNTGIECVDLRRIRTRIALLFKSADLRVTPLCFFTQKVEQSVLIHLRTILTNQFENFLCSVNRTGKESVQSQIHIACRILYVQHLFLGFNVLYCVIGSWIWITGIVFIADTHNLHTSLVLFIK